jgi:hypothetical protein
MHELKIDIGNGQIIGDMCFKIAVGISRHFEKPWNQILIAVAQLLKDWFV